jgi:uncharacterized damage-inducible protein DinB
LHAQTDGIWQGYDPEWSHVSRQLIALAEATPQEKFAWRPGPDVRSTSEVYMHIVIGNFYLLSVTGPKMPADLSSLDLDAVKTAHGAAKPADLRRKVKIQGVDADVDGIYLRIIVHANEHMGQLIAYARMNGITPPWSQ